MWSHSELVICFKKWDFSSIRIVDDDVSVRELIPDNLGNTLEDDLYINEPVVAGNLVCRRLV